MAEYTREFRIEIKVYHDTNKGTYEDDDVFYSIEDAVEWLEDYVVD